MTIQHGGFGTGGGAGGLQLLSVADDYVYSAYPTSTNYHTLTLPDPPGGGWNRLKFYGLNYAARKTDGPLTDPYGTDNSKTLGWSPAPTTGEFYHQDDLYGATAFTNQGNGGWWDYITPLSPLDDPADFDVDFPIGICRSSSVYLWYLIYNLEGNNLRWVPGSTYTNVTTRPNDVGLTHIIIEGA